MDFVKVFEKEMKYFPYHSKDGNVEKYLRLRYKFFINNIKNLDNTIEFNKQLQKKIPEMIYTTNSICNILKIGKENFFRGYQEFEKLMCDGLLKILKNARIGNHIEKSNMTPLNLYRIRMFNKKPINVTQLDMYTLGEEVNSIYANRFNLASESTLYLGSSFYVCWEELNRPEFEKIYISRFEPISKFNYLEIAYPPNVIVEKYKDKPEDYFTILINENNKLNPTRQMTIDEIVDYFFSYLFMVSCCIRVKNLNDNFKEEYLISQYLNAYNKEHKDFEAIIYYSSKICCSNTNNRLCHNYAFTQYDKIKKCFRVTDPVPVKIINEFDLSQIGNNKKSNNDLMQFEMFKGLKVNYKDTAWGKIEFFMQNLEAYDIEDEG